MRRFCVPILWVTALATACAHADEFSWQFAGGMRESDVGTSVEADGATLTATYYFRPVDDTAGPYALAAFLNRNSRIGARYSEEKVTAVVPVFGLGPVPLPPRPPVTVSNRAASHSLSGRHVWRTTGWYVGAAVAEADAAHPAPLPTSFSVLGDDVSSRSLAFGKYLGRSTTVELSFEAAETTLTSELPLYCSGGFCAISPIARLTSTSETDSESIGISALHVGSLGKFTYSFSGSVTSNETETTLDVVETPVLPPPPVLSTIPPFGRFYTVPGPRFAVFESRRERYALAGELFPTQAFGIRLGYTRWDGDESLDESYEVGATWFFRRKIGVRIGLARTKSGLPITTIRDVDTVTLRVIGRL